MKGVDDKRVYLLECKVGKTKGLLGSMLGSMLRKYWTNVIASMSEGQVLDEYYKYTEKSHDR